ncbi:hypothetical protein JCM10207_005677 [Rhodosporidiobolus poonsookiae]
MSDLNFMELLMFLRPVESDYKYRLPKPPGPPGWVLPPSLASSAPPFEVSPPADMKALRRRVETVLREEREARMTAEEKAASQAEAAKRERNRKKKERKMKAKERGGEGEAEGAKEEEETAQPEVAAEQPADGAETTPAAPSPPASTDAPPSSAELALPRSSPDASYGLDPTADFPPELHAYFAKLYQRVWTNACKMRTQTWQRVMPEFLHGEIAERGWGNIVFHDILEKDKPHGAFSRGEDGKFELHAEA